MATVICILIILTACVFVRGYNVDTTIPVIKTGPAGSYFGYSVAQHQQVRMKDAFTATDEVIGNYIVVGAPKLDIATAPENYTGGIYKCNAVSPSPDDCELLLENEYKSADVGRRDQWLGVVVRSGGAGKEVVACAHRYKVGGNNNYGIGNCYLLPQDLQFNRENGQGNIISPCQGYSIRNEHMEYAFCQGGASAFISDERRLIIGSPGAINWRGMLTEMDVSPFGMRRKYKSPTTDADDPPPPVPTFSMLGYSVVGGKFDNSGNLYYVAGAPRSREGGEVVLFTEMSSGSLLKYEESQKIMGDLPFSGFGQDLIAVDLNNDSIDDLVVGCPMYHKKEEDTIRVGGAIYVYLSNGNEINYTQPQIIKGRSLSQKQCDSLQCLHGRFGFSLAKAGDLNGDGFQDIAVGAPYEGQGAVYIFHGSKDGLKVPFSQRIYASELPNSDKWTTFGYSLSGGIDLDDNTYPDILVGSFDVDKVALLRTRPIIYLHSNVSVYPDKLNMSSVAGKKCQYDNVLKYCVQLKLCLRYTAEPAERFDESIEIIYKIVAEPDRISPRVEFKQGTGSGSMVEDKFMLLPQKLTGLSTDTGDPKYSCISQIAYLKDTITDVVSTLEFGISYRLPERTTPIPTPYAGALPDINTYPILDAGLTGEESMVITKVEFAKKCGDNNECESNLVMDVSLDLRHDTNGKPVLEQGITKELRVMVTIENTYEVAYQIMFYFTKPETLKYESSEPNIECDAVYKNKTLYECKAVGSKEIGSPLKGGEFKAFTLKFGTDKVSPAYKEIEMSFWVNTTSKELTPDADYIKIPIRVFVNADMQVSGKSFPDSNIPYSGIIRGESAITNEHMIGPSVNHTFTIYNNGPGTVQSADLTIKWPYEVASKYTHGKHLLYLMQPPQVLGGGDSGTVCFENPDIINPANKKEDYALNIRPQNVDPAGEGGPEYNIVPETRRRRRQVSDEEDSENNLEEPVEIRAEEPRTLEAREKKRSVSLDCQSGSAKCHEIRCRIGTLQRNKQVQIKIRSRLWESTLLEDYRHVDEVKIQSMAILTIRPELNVVQSNYTNDIGYITTVAIPSLQIAPKQEVAWWIYLVAVLGGIILLIVIALILWKCGFFKRKKFDQSPTYNAKLEKNWQTSDIHTSSPIYNAKAEKTYNPDEKYSFIK